MYLCLHLYCVYFPRALLCLNIRVCVYYKAALISSNPLRVDTVAWRFLSRRTLERHG